MLIHHIGENKARDLLDSIQGPLSSENRQRLAIELAEYLLQAVQEDMSLEERKKSKKRSGLMRDLQARHLLVALADQALRSRNSARVADQIQYLLRRYPLSTAFSWWDRFQLSLFRLLGRPFSSFSVPLFTKTMMREMSDVLIEEEKFPGVIKELNALGIHVNAHFLGEAILGEKEASRRRDHYQKAMTDPRIEHLSIKISSIFSQIHLLAWEETVEQLSSRLISLFQAAFAGRLLTSNQQTIHLSSPSPLSSPLMGEDMIFDNGLIDLWRSAATREKSITLDMEGYSDLCLTVAAFKKALEHPELQNTIGGIALQAYLPDSFEVLKELTEWARKRVHNGGAPIFVRVVKGANLSMEQIEAATKGWPMAPYSQKWETDANFKRMVEFACHPDHASAVHIGIGSHNILDIAYTLILRKEHRLENTVRFEMLTGMAPALSRVVNRLSGNLLLYCPVAAHTCLLYTSPSPRD